MYNAIVRLIYTVCPAVMLILAACGGSGDESSARSLMQQAREAIDKGEYPQAIELIDSIDHAYPAQVDVRRRAMPLKSEAMVGHLENQLIATQQILDRYQDEYEQLKQQFTTVTDNGQDPYLIRSGAYGKNIAGSTAVQARVNASDASFYLTASNSGPKVGITSVTLHGTNGNMTTLPLSDSQRAGDMDTYGTDLATFANSECDTLGAWAYHHAGAVTSATLSGPGSTREIKFNKQQGDQFALAWRLAFLAHKVNNARILHDKLERQILIARDHLNNDNNNQ